MNNERNCLNCAWVVLKEGNRYVCVHPYVLESVKDVEASCKEHQFQYELEQDILDQLN